MKAIDLTLPEFAFVESSGHDGDSLHGRNVILHVRSASVLEVLDRDKALLHDSTLTFNFVNHNLVGGTEQLTIALHYCATLDARLDADIIRREILIPAAKWFCEYCDWEDRNVIDNEF